MSKKVTRLRPTPPEPTAESPYAQLDWVWRRYVRRYTNEATRLSTVRRLSEYKHFLGDKHGYDERLAKDPRFYLSVHWDYFALQNAEKYWRSRGYAEYTIQSRVKVLRRVMNFAASENLTSVSFFIDPQLNEPQRETSQRAAYNEEELEFIRRAITPAVTHAKAIVAGYMRTRAGRDPRTPRGWNFRSENKLAGKVQSLADITGGWKSWENMVWYFENILDCQPFRQTYALRDKHESFCRAASEYHGGIDAVWRKLGVATLIDINLIVPLSMKLAWETGLNSETIYRLNRDCYRESHPLTGLPYLRYYKERSTGDKDLHLTLLDSSSQSDIHFLQKQSEIIKNTISLILKLTEPLVATAKEEDKNILLLVQVSSAGSDRPVGEVQRLNKNKIYAWASQCKKLSPEEGDDIPSNINLARFRPTKITQMVRDGIDFFRVQAAAGHAHAKTTTKYIATHQLGDQERREVSAALGKIHQNRIELEQNPMPSYAANAMRHQEGVIYKGLLCDCKNVFDPPNTVRRLPVYKEGQACTYWNMCLLCPNALITRQHLPLLATYYREIKAAIDAGNLGNAPNGMLYRKAAAVLEGIFLEFGDEAVAWAQDVAECDDQYIDPVTYRVVRTE